MNPELGQLPEGWEMPTAAVYGDSRTASYAFNRDPEHPVCISIRMATSYPRGAPG